MFPFGTMSSHTDNKKNDHIKTHNQDTLRNTPDTPSLLFILSHYIHLLRLSKTTPTRPKLCLIHPNRLSNTRIKHVSMRSAQPTRYLRLLTYAMIVLRSLLLPLPLTLLLLRWQTRIVLITIRLTR